MGARGEFKRKSPSFEDPRRPHTLFMLGPATAAPAAPVAPAPAPAPAAARRPYRGGRREPAPEPRCAWVVLLMIGDAYAPGALVVAHSLRAARTRHPLVCMVTHDVPAETRARLLGEPGRPIFDRVVEVPYIRRATRRFASQRQEEMYGSWIDRSFTKWNCLAFVEYERVLFIDADMVVLANCDDLFELPPPAASYSHPWARPWQAQGGICSPYVAEGGADIPHGARVPAALVLDALSGARFGGSSYVGGGGLVLLEPSAERFAEYLALVGEGEVYGAQFACTSGGDETSIACLYARAGRDWTNIHQRYSAIPWKTEWVSRDIRVYHYLGRKPWEMSREEWPDLADWWGHADRLVAAHPGLRETFYPTVASVAPLDAECAQLRLTNDLRSYVLSTAKQALRTPAERAAAKREINNLLERWLLTMANAPRAAEGEGAPVAGAPRAAEGEAAPVAWAALYRRSSLEDPFNNKLAGELVEKRLVRSSTAAGELVARVLAVANSRLGQLPRPTGARLLLDETSLRYGSHFRAPLSPRLRLLIALGGEEATARVAMRYAAVGSAGQQWGLPQAHVDRLYREFGVRNEAFASPLNARLLGKRGARYCSLFPDTDSAFGSCGDFFAPGLPACDGNWVVNPPFIEELMARAARHVESALIEKLAAGAGQTFFFIIPAWADSEVYSLLHLSPFLAAELLCEPGRYYFEEPDGARVDTRAASIYFALSTEPPASRDLLAGALQDLVARA